jgi:hypothetical protein
MVPVNLSMSQPGQVSRRTQKGRRRGQMPQKRHCQNKPPRGFSQNESDLKSRIPLLQQTKRRKLKKNRLPKQSNQNSLIPSESRNNETIGLSKE